MAATCEHLDQIKGEPATPSEPVCEECAVEGTTWVALRRCLSCGHVGCCDSSVGTHATKHFQQSEHPVMQSAMPGDTWRWCYIDEVTAPE